MRELKFRAWVARYKKYMPIISITWDASNRPMLIKLEDTFGDSLVLNSEDVLLEQYTGLKDKNGKEIYEGDIVDYDDDGKCIGVVKYDAPHYELIDKDGYAMFLKGAPHQTIIGNIHENKELLEEE